MERHIHQVQCGQYCYAKYANYTAAQKGAVIFCNTDLDGKDNEDMKGRDMSSGVIFGEDLI
jgi:hypothetical protein